MKVYFVAYRPELDVAYFDAVKGNIIRNYSLYCKLMREADYVFAVQNNQITKIHKGNPPYNSEEDIVMLTLAGYYGGNLTK